MRIFFYRISVIKKAFEKIDLCREKYCRNNQQMGVVPVGTLSVGCIDTDDTGNWVNDILINVDMNNAWW